MEETLLWKTIIQFRGETWGLGDTGHSLLVASGALGCCYTLEFHVCFSDPPSSLAVTMKYGTLHSTCSDFGHSQQQWLRCSVV
jgi:hypothetical protein